MNTKLTKNQVDLIRDYLRNNPKQEPVAVGSYFARIAEVDRDTEMRISNVAGMLIRGEDSDRELAPFVETTD